MTGSFAGVAAFAERFGTLEDNEKYFQMGMEQQLHPDHREILSVGNALGESSMMIAVEPEAELLWHCDDGRRNLAGSAQGRRKVVAKSFHTRWNGGDP